MRVILYSDIMKEMCDIAFRYIIKEIVVFHLDNIKEIICETLHLDTMNVILQV